MSAITPLFAGERTAAKLFDMKSTEFTDLVEQGHLPHPRDIGGIKRWDIEELRRIIRGDAATGETMEW